MRSIIGLDKYLTTPPDDGFDNWCEETIEALSEDFFNENENWVLNNNGRCNKWLNELFNSGIEPKESAIAIEQLFYLNER